MHQLTMFDIRPEPRVPARRPPAEAPRGDAAEPDLDSYDRVIVMFSGGKDSVASVLHLLERGVSRERIELWHHEIDGREGSTLMDWPVTTAYCRAFAQALGLTLSFSWKVGGFEREMLREHAPTAPTAFELPDGSIGRSGGAGGPNTRRRFPQVSADLSTRWCSSYLKIQVGEAALRNQQRFTLTRTLVVTGERAAESPCRARYAAFERHKAAASTRHVDHWRAIHGWSDDQVWDIMRRWRINPHPAYRLGWGRCSCAACIFGSADQWASLRAVNPAQFRRVAEYEAAFGTTIRRDGVPIDQLADAGTPFAAISEADIAAARSTEWREPIILAEGAWKRPAGAQGDATGPS